MNIAEDNRLKEELIQLINDHPNNYSRMITSKSKTYLKEYVEMKTPLLNDKKYLLSTKCYWILHDFTDFPKCKMCGNPIMSNVKITVGYSKYCSNRCAQSDKETILKSRQTRLERYGSETYVNTEKTKETCLEKYGVSNPNKLKETRDKIKNTCLEKFGVDTNCRLDSFKEERKHTWLEKYGTENPMSLDYVRNKYKETCIDKYGVENVSQSTDIKKKKEETYLMHFGVRHSAMSKEVQEKTKETCIKRYGVEYPAQNHEIFCKTIKRYEYDGKMFHSSWEVFVYFYLKDNKIRFEYQPNSNFIFEFNRKDA